MRIVICDVGLGNLRSVERALLEAARGRGADVEVTGEPERVRAADRLVVPGQGAFRDCARALAGPLGEAVRDHVAAERPYLGLCLGMQILFASSEESPGSAGLGLLEGKVVRLADTAPAEGRAPAQPLKVPHVGWNTVAPSAQRGLLPEEADYFCFMHSYVAVPADPSVVAGTTDYGQSFVSAVTRGNLFACQFHPEKSQRAGLALLERFVAA